MSIKEELQKIRERLEKSGPCGPYSNCNDDRVRLLACVERLEDALKQVIFYGEVNHGTKSKDYEQVARIGLSDASAILTGESEKGDGG